MLEMLERIGKYIFFIVVFSIAIIVNIIKVDSMPVINYMCGLFILFFGYAIIDELYNNKEA